MAEKWHELQSRDAQHKPLQHKRAHRDDRQITHLICVRLKHLLYGFFRGALGHL